MKFAQAGLAVAGSILLFGSSATCQSFSSCNPLLTCKSNSKTMRANIDLFKRVVQQIQLWEEPSVSTLGMEL